VNSAVKSPVGFFDVHSRTEVGTPGVVSLGGYPTHWSTVFYIDMLKKAMELHGPMEISNSVQCSHLTSKDFNGIFKQHCIRISNGGKGRWGYNAFGADVMQREVSRGLP
jgi:hypothetical protein